ncbi:MAG: tyrosine-protein phosphatase YwqE [Herpetosiphonaceae bacterium]|nr:MAG: tyrosine-protein phosphatase YwqE [Herpetosiphonaceae bacterium]
MYDLHCHLLPGVDDGPQTWEEALALARALIADGVRTAAATPHGFGSPKCRRHSAEELRQRTDELQQRLRAADLPLSVVTGQELYPLPDLASRLRAGSALPYASSHTVLLESPFDTLSEALEHLIFDLQIAGFRVLLAHPERIDEVQRDPNRLIRLVEKGVYTQVTAASLAGMHGSRLRSTAEALLLSGMCHVLASDAHAAEGRRAPCLSQALAAATTLVGEEAARSLVDQIPAALLQDAPLPPPEPRPYRPVKRRRWFLFS